MCAKVQSHWMTSTLKSLEVDRQVGTGLHMIRIDHLIYIGYVCKLLLE